MLSSRVILLFVAVSCVAALRANRVPKERMRRWVQNNEEARLKRAIRDRVRPTGRQLLIDAGVGSVLRNAPVGAQLIATQPPIPAILGRLPDNATLIRPNIVDTFRCDDRVYGYYADVDNECQVFHICLPLQQLYPANFTSAITYQFSFICPEHTIFTQDAMVCAWSTEAVPCEYAPDLYWMNQNFFREVEDSFGTRYAHVNEPLR